MTQHQPSEWEEKYIDGVVNHLKAWQVEGNKERFEQEVEQLKKLFKVVESSALKRGIEMSLEALPKEKVEKCRMTCISCDMEKGWEEWCECSCHKDDVQDFNSALGQSKEAILKLLDL